MAYNDLNFVTWEDFIIDTITNNHNALPNFRFFAIKGLCDNVEAIQ